jgi:hypothetical protein
LGVSSANVRLLVLIAAAASLGGSSVFPDHAYGYFRVPVKQCYRTAAGFEDECVTKFNTIAISQRDGQSAFVGIDIAGDNGHSCAYYAIARVTDGEIVASARGRRDGTICKIQLRVSESGAASFKVMDPIASCTLNFCSAKAGMYEGVGFIRHLRAANNKLQRTRGGSFGEQ